MSFSLLYSVWHKWRRPDQHSRTQRSNEKTFGTTGKNLLEESVILSVALHQSWCLSKTQLPSQLDFHPIWLFQVGHRDLEDILRDIDLNGDGHVDFEGNADNVVCETTIRYLYRRIHFTVWCLLLSFLCFCPSFTQTHTHIPTLVWLISLYHADSEVKGWRQQFCLSDYLHTKRLCHLTDYTQRKDAYSLSKTKYTAYPKKKNHIL